MVAKSFSMAAFIVGRGFPVERTGLDPYTSRPYFTFSDDAIPVAVEYKRTVDALNALVRRGEAR
jgi:hypothetical protein